MKYFFSKLIWFIPNYLVELLITEKLVTALDEAHQHVCRGQDLAMLTSSGIYYSICCKFIEILRNSKYGSVDYVRETFHNTLFQYTGEKESDIKELKELVNIINHKLKYLE